MVFFEKSILGFFLNSYGFLWKIHKDFSEIYRFFFTKNHNKEKTDKKSVVPEPSNVYPSMYMQNEIHC